MGGGAPLSAEARRCRAHPLLRRPFRRPIGGHICRSTQRANRCRSATPASLLPLSFSLDKMPATLQLTQSRRREGGSRVLIRQAGCQSRDRAVDWLVEFLEEEEEGILSALGVLKGEEEGGRGSYGGAGGRRGSPSIGASTRRGRGDRKGHTMRTLRPEGASCGAGGDGWGDAGTARGSSVDARTRRGSPGDVGTKGGGRRVDDWCRVGAERGRGDHRGPPPDTRGPEAVPHRPAEFAGSTRGRARPSRGRGPNMAPTVATGYADFRRAPPVFKATSGVLGGSAVHVTGSDAKSAAGSDAGSTL